jgi:putative membrane protein
MRRTTRWLLTAGILIFVGVLASQGLRAVFSTLALAGWGLLLIALYHAVPLVLDAGAIRVLIASGCSGSMRDAVLARWVGESANSLMPAGQIGGPIMMARHLTLRGMRVPDAVAAITVSTTMQTVAQIGFALVGVSLLGAHASRMAGSGLRTGSLIASGLLALPLLGFYLLQRRGLFSKVMRTAARFFGKRDWSDWMSHAQAIDIAVEQTYGRAGAVAGSFALSLLSWLIGTVEVYLFLELIGSRVGWSDALVLESVGQAIRGAAFAIPGALGVQEGGYLLLASAVGLPAETGLALALAKRARELLLGVPGLWYLHVFEKAAAAAIQPTSR